MIEVKRLKEEGNHLQIVIGGIDVAIANALRRIMINEVATMAIDDVIIIENSSIMKDESLALRLGLIPLTTDLDSYLLPQECSCNSELGCSNCSVTLTLDSEATDTIRTIYSKDLRSYDPNVTPVNANIPITKLASGQKVRLEAYAKLGKGLDHAKWQPVASCAYKYAPVIQIDREKCDLCEKCIHACLKHVLTLNKEVKISNAEQCNLCRECEKACPQDAIQVQQRKDAYIFTIESTGALPPNKIFLEAINILQEKTLTFKERLTQTGREQE